MCFDCVGVFSLLRDTHIRHYKYAHVSSRTQYMQTKQNCTSMSRFVLIYFHLAYFITKSLKIKFIANLIIFQSNPISFSWSKRIRPDSHACKECKQKKKYNLFLENSCNGMHVNIQNMKQ